MAKLLLLLVVAFWLPTEFRVTAASVSLMGSTNLALAGQGTYNEAWWYEYTATDAGLDHGCMGVMAAGFTNLPGTIALPVTLQAGDYAVLLKTQQYGSPYPTTTLTAGDYTGTFSNLYSANLGGQWQLPFIFASGVPFSNVVIMWNKTKDIAVLQQTLLNGIYITSITNTLVDKFDRIVDLTVSGTITSNTVAGNILDNSSFELGMHKGWWNATTDGRTNLAAMISTNSRSGTKSARVVYGQAVNTRLYYLKSNATYVTSGYFKTESGIRSVKIGLVHPFAAELPAGYANPFPTLTTATVSNEWTRVAATNVVRSAAGTRLYVTVAAAGSGTNAIFADDIQLEQSATPSNYAPKASIEVALATTNAMAIYIDGVHSNATLQAYNTDAARNLAIGYETRDMHNTLRASGTFEMLATNGFTETTIGIHPGLRGAFSLRLTDVGYEDELAFCVVPAPSGATTNAAFGVHGTINRGAFYLEGTQIMGGAWFRGLSHAGAFRWDLAEPTNNVWNWTWADSSVADVTNSSVAFLGVLYERPNWASEPPQVDDWIDYVTNVVARYPMIQYWEIDNEPFAVMTAAEYVVLLTNTVPAIKAINPDARIIALGGSSYPYWIDDFFAAAPTNYLTNVFAASVHVYPTVPSSAGIATLNTMREQLAGIEMWNTETGTKSTGYRRGLDGNYIRYSGSTYSHKDSLPWVQDMVWAADSVMQNHLNSVGLGCSVVCNYDSRLPANNITDHQFSDIDLDDSFKTRGVQRAVMAWMLDTITNRYNASHAGVQLYAFQRNDGEIVAGHYSDTNTSVTVTTTLSQQFRPVDAAGNVGVLADSAFTVGHRVGYLLGTNVTWNAFTNALWTGTITNTPDTNAPSLAFVPMDTWDDSHVVASWLAIDDVDTPRENTPNAVLYSYRQDGGPWSEWTATSYFEADISQRMVLEVRAKDTAGNTTDTMTKTFGAGPHATATAMTVGTLIIP